MNYYLLRWLLAIGLCASSLSLNAQGQEPTPLLPAPAVHRPGYLMVGPSVFFADDGRTYGGADISMGGLVGQRLIIGGTLSISGRRWVDTNYGYRATAPAVGLYTLEASTRYALTNTPHVRLELLNGIGYGAAGLFDRDQSVRVVTHTRTGTTTSYQPRRMALSEHLLLEAGLGLTLKPRRGPWLTMQASRRQLLGDSTFGPPTGFSHWVWTLGITLPYNE